MIAIILGFLSFGVVLMKKRSLDFLKKPGSVVWMGIVMYLITLGWACHAKFSSYSYDDFDLAIDAQSIWNILHGSIVSSIHGIPFLGNHMRLILFLIAPLYAVFPTPLLLLYLQTLMLGVGAWGIFVLGSRELPHKWAGWLSLVYLVYPPLIFLNLYEFHPVALAVPFLIGMLYFYKTERFPMFLLFLFLALSCQENIALIAVAFSFYALIDGRRGRWFWTPLVTGITYFMPVVFLIMPCLNNNTIQFMKLYGHLGDSLPEILGNIILHPVYALKFMFSAEKLVFLNALLGPVAYLSLFSPLSLLPALLVAVPRLLSMRASEAVIVYHYQAEFIPFVFFAAIYGMKRLTSLRYRIAKLALCTALIIFPLAGVLTTGVLPTLSQAISSPWNKSFLPARKNAIIRNLPENARVLATFDFLPRLANRKSLYSLHHVYGGFHTLSDVPYQMPDVDYIIMDTNDPLTFSTKGFYSPENYRRLRTVLDDSGWEVIEHVDSLLVFRRAHNRPAEKPLNLVEYVKEPVKMNRNVEQITNGAIRLTGFDLGRADENHVVPLTLFWQKCRESDEDYDTLLTVSDGEVFYRGKLSPGSRIYPPQSWPTDSLIADRHRVHLERGVRSSADIQVCVELLLLGH